MWGCYCEQNSDDELEGSEGAVSISDTLEPGCSFQVESDRPLDYFSLLITDNMLQHIVDQTNLHAEQFISSHDLALHS